MKRAAAFLDRDGTIIREADYLSRLEDLELLPGAAVALKRLGEAGFLRLVVTNQSGVARKFFDAAFVEAAHEELRQRLRDEGGDVDGFYVCPHHPDHSGPCGCRKPLPGLVLRAVAEWAVDLSASWVIGDKASDVALARAVGCRAALVRTGYGRATEAELRASGTVADVTADDLLAATEEILAGEGAGKGRDGRDR
ncbi:MAG: HAD family hydrolase [Deltaproteobacteria bacterium]|nr:HAD family hydrolase [Deltaproteobacteria bacterium]